MPYDIRMVSQDKLVQIKLSGPVTPELVDEIYPGVINMAKEYGCKGVLADFRDVTKHLSVLEKYKLGRSLGDFGFARSYKIAIVYSQSDPEDDFFETAARNAGYIVRIFRDIQEARDWLLS